jgi:hypothetical protein
MNHQLILTYTVVYGEAPNVALDELFKSTSIDNARGLTEFFNANEELYKTTTGTLELLREKWFSAPNAPFFKFVTEAIIKNQHRFPDSDIVIFNPLSSLGFLEKLLKYLQQDTGEGNGKEASSSQRERDLFDAYLIINEQFNRTDNGIEVAREKFPDEANFWLFLYKPFQYADLINRDLRELYITEVYKAVLLFELLENNAKTQPILIEFLKQYACQSWQIYLQAMMGLPVTSLGSSSEVPNNYVQLDKQLPFYETCVKILDSINAELPDVDLKEDFLFLRNHPIFRTDEDKFQVIYKRFVIEKIFRAQYFELSTLSEKIGVMSKNKFRTLVYTSAYSEDLLLYNALDKIFKNADQRIHGKTMEEKAPRAGTTDYFAYQDQHIYLFESKDILIKKEVKDRLQIPEIREEFRKKFYNDPDGDKAVLQLAKNIKKILDGEYAQFGYVTGKFRGICPIIVVHSDAFNVLALNQILKKWFKEACNQVGISKKDQYKILPVVLIDINTLLYLQDKINGNNFHLHQIIDDYHTTGNLGKAKKRGVRSAIDYSSIYLLPFSHYLEQFIKRHRPIKSPVMIRDKIKKIILDAKQSGK